MRCFDHPDVEAVGLCKSCGKGLCVRCAHDLARGLACRDRCEQDVRDLIALTAHGLRTSARSDSALGASRQALHGSAWLLMAIGGGTLFAGFVLEALLVLGLLGGVCLIFGALLLAVARRMPEPDEPS